MGQMQVIQIPAWMALLLVAAIPAGIGIGAWLGGWLTRRRDDSRWQRERERDELRRQREREREDLRWLHEREREELRRQHDREQAEQQRQREFSHDLWERKLAAFGEFLGAFDKVHDAACLLSVRGRSTEKAHESLDALERGIEDTMKPFDVLRVIAGADLVQACYDAVENAARCWDHDGSTEASAAALDSLVRLREDLHTRIRYTLGIEGPGALPTVDTVFSARADENAPPGRPGWVPA